ncbi:hypothetical protein MGN70_002719 [Eutypa lata]|nr:hypothetical protein MGN70_002719 [Eutypa lata]
MLPEAEALDWLDNVAAPELDDADSELDSRGVEASLDTVVEVESERIPEASLVELLLLLIEASLMVVLEVSEAPEVEDAKPDVDIEEVVDCPPELVSIADIDVGVDTIGDVEDVSVLLDDGNVVDMTVEGDIEWDNVDVVSIKGDEDVKNDDDGDNGEDDIMVEVGEIVVVNSDATVDDEIIVSIKETLLLPLLANPVSGLDGEDTVSVDAVIPGELAEVMMPL